MGSMTRILVLGALASISDDSEIVWRDVSSHREFQNLAIGTRRTKLGMVSQGFQNRGI